MPHALLGALPPHSFEPVAGHQALLFSESKPKVLMVFQCAPRAPSQCALKRIQETAPELSVAYSQIVFLKDTTSIKETPACYLKSNTWGLRVALLRCGVQT